MKKLIIILCLLTTPVLAGEFRMKCKSIDDGDGFYTMTLCEDETQSCFIPKNKNQQPLCVNKQRKI